MATKKAKKEPLSEPRSDKEKPGLKAPTKRGAEGHQVNESRVERQFTEMKKKHPDAVLLFRTGDFYELFGEDAVKASELLGITLTRRANGSDKYIELAGFPRHALDAYLPKLVRAGQRVAICEQLEDPKLTKTAKQKVVETITPKAAPKSKPAPTSLSAESVKPVAEIKTVNGDKITDAQVFQWKSKGDGWYFMAKINGQKLRPQMITEGEAQAFLKGNRTLHGMIQQYYPTKLQKKVDVKHYTFPLSFIVPSSDEKLEIQKFNVYKEKSADSPNYGKWMFFAEVNGRKMSAPGTSHQLLAYFDRTETAGQLISAVFGAKLHLKSHYEQFQLPAGLKIDDIRIQSKPIPDTKAWSISVSLADGRTTSTKEITFEDGYSFWRAKTADRAQIASKYFYDELKTFVQATKEEVKKTSPRHKL